MSDYVFVNGELVPVKRKSSVLLTHHELADDELMHWKYIKKERGKNGKWIYYYNRNAVKQDLEKVADALGADEYERLKKAESDYKNADMDRSNARGNYLDYRTSLNNTKPTVDDQRAQYLYGVYTTANKRYAEAGRKYTEAQNEFNKTPLGVVTKAADTVKRGMQVVSNLINRISKRAKNGK